VVRHSDPIPPPSYSSDKDRAAQIDTLRKLLETLIQMINSTGGSQQVIPQGGSFILPVQSQPLSNPGTTNTTRSCLTLARSMDIGANDQMTGGEVSSLQQFLRGTGDFTYPEITGYYGQSTSQAVQKWQARNGVVTSGTPASTGFGRVGARTRTVMSSCR
ncbi:MAG: peptidoglycan-binding domain-containing protein, partial [Candidatus Paceibacterota bacterium]